MRRTIILCATMAATCCWTGCNKGGGVDGTVSGPQGAFTLAWSEYPSWSVFGVADEAGLIDKDEGKKGTLEEKWGVDIVLKQLDYEPCLAASLPSLTFIRARNVIMKESPMELF